MQWNAIIWTLLYVLHIIRKKFKFSLYHIFFQIIFSEKRDFEGIFA